VWVSLSSQAFFFPFGGVSRDKGVLSKTPLFEPTEGLTLVTDNTLAANFSHGSPVDGLLSGRVSRYDLRVRIEAYRLRKNAGSYRAEPVGSSLSVMEGSRLVELESGDLPYQGRSFSLHASGEGPGRFILQVEPLEPDGDYEYFLGYAYSLKGSPDFDRLLHQIDILESYAEEAAEGMEDSIVIGARGVRIDDKATLLAFLKSYDAKKQRVFGNTTSAPGTLTRLIVAAPTPTAKGDLIRSVNERVCLLMAASPYEHLRPMGARIPSGIERADMDAQEADQACRAALRFGSDSQSVRYAAYRAGSEASVRAGITERLPELRGELETLAEEGHLAARTEVALLNMGHLGVPTDLDKVREMLRAEHGRGNPVASYFLGLVIVDGHLAVEDRAQGLPYLEAAAEGGVVRAYWKIGTHHLRKQTPESTEAAFVSFMKGVDEDEPRSMTAAADMYLAGDVVERQPDKAFDLYRKAARIEEIDRALHMMGFMKLHGIGTFKSLRTARGYLERAVNRGYEAAKPELGYMYLAGLGGDQNIENGEIYLNESSQAGFFSAEHYRRRYENELARKNVTSQDK
jgi:TPR repeat protein